MENRGIATTIIVLILVVIAGYWLFNTPKGAVVRQSVNNFVECQKYGYPVTGTYPRECRTPSGQIFAESALVASVGSYGSPVYPAAYSSNKTLYPAYPGSMSATTSKAYITYPIDSATARSSHSTPRNYNTSSSTSYYSYSYVAPDPVSYAYYPEPTAQGGCYVSGCSSQICSDQPGLASTCEFRQEYACYQTARCERQASGQCGWTPTAELNACLSSR